METHSVIHMITSAKNAQEDDDDDEEEFVVKKESPSPSRGLSCISLTVAFLSTLNLSFITEGQLLV